MIRKCFVSAAALTIIIECSSLCQAQESDGQRLLEAARTGQVGTVQKLLDPKVSPKARDENGRTPLHLAVGGHQVIAETLAQ